LKTEFTKRKATPLPSFGTFLYDIFNILLKN